MDMQYGYLLTGQMKWDIYDALHDSKYELESRMREYLRKAGTKEQVSNYICKETAKRIVTVYRAMYTIGMGDDIKWPVFTDAEKNYDGTYAKRMELTATK